LPLVAGDGLSVTASEAPACRGLFLGGVGYPSGTVDDGTTGTVDDGTTGTVDDGTTRLGLPE
jgi:hypothetical protein